MAFNKTESILGTGDDAAQVGAEANLIFTATFIGAAIWYNLKYGDKAWEIAMEPDRETFEKDKDTGKTGEERRTESDQKSMKAHNAACSKVNHVVRNAIGKKGILWRMTPMFARGGSICAGPNAERDYGTWDTDLAKKVYKVLTDTNTPTVSSPSGAARKHEHSMYIGRGAYCGLVADRAEVPKPGGSPDETVEEIQAVVAMSTLRSTLTEDTVGIGNRWVPPAGALARRAKYPNKDLPDKYKNSKRTNYESGEATWGVIEDMSNQLELEKQGMQFLPPNEDLGNVDYDVTVGYTHGMIRCIYEQKRIDRGEVYEMSIGTGTFKLASCLSCSLFMLAQGANASCSHIGAGQSWAPYYQQVADLSGAEQRQSIHNFSHHPDHPGMTLAKSIEVCNAKHSAHMDHWMRLGLWALNKADLNKCLADNQYMTALVALQKKVAYTFNKEAAEPKYVAPENDTFSTVARDLYLDAMTFHVKDVDRLTSALKFGDGHLYADGTWDWREDRTVTPDHEGTWTTWKTDVTDDDVIQLITPPEPMLTTKFNISITAGFPGFAWPTAQLVRRFGKIDTTKDKEIVIDPSTGKGTFEVAGHPTYWAIKWSTDQYPHSIKPDPKTSIHLPGGGNYLYTLTKASD